MTIQKDIKNFIKPRYFKILATTLNPKSEGLDPYEEDQFKKLITDSILGHKYSAIRIVIIGEVRNAGYRVWIERRARLKGLQVWSKYQGSNQVEVVAIGNGEELEDLIRDAWKGSKRSKVEKVVQYWFNKPKKLGAGEDLTNLPWSQDTADRYIDTQNQLGDMLDEPNHYPDKGRLVGTDELVRVSEDRNLFHSRCGLKELYFVSPDNVIGMQRSQSTRVSSIVHFLTDHKQAAKDFLQRSNLPVPQGGIFEELEEAKEFFKTCKNAMVVKPAVGLNGTGVTVDIRSADALETAWQYAKQYHHKIVIEEMIIGVDIRVVVVGGKARAALLRVPANIKGDGIKTIEELIEEKNHLRLQNPRLRKNLLITDAYSDAYFQRQGHSMKSVPKKNEDVFLHLKANICKGADSISITEHIHPDLMRLAEDASKAFGVNDYWGIDLMVGRIDQSRDQDQCAIIELNSTANIENVIYPLYGPSFDSAKELVKHLFPKKMEDSDYKIKNYKVEVTGIFGETFCSWLMERAEKLEISGWIEEYKTDAGIQKLQMTVSGYEHKVYFLLEDIYNWQNDNHVVDGIYILGECDVQQDGFKIIPIEEKEDLLDSKNSPKIQVIEIDALPINAFDQYDKDKNLNVQLFMKDFNERGYQTEYLYEGIFEISKDNITGITGMRHSSLFCDKVTTNIHPAKKILALNGLPTLRGTLFRHTKKSDAEEYRIKLNGPVIATRLHPRRQRNDLLNDYSELKKFWKGAKKIGTGKILMEEYIKGWNTCVAIVGDEAVGALIIEPASILGDGVSTISKLIEEKEQQRAQHPIYKEKPISDNKFLSGELKRQGLTVDSILSKGEKAFLESRFNLDLGGETLGFTEQLHDDFKNKAVQAVKAIPGLEFAYVYMTIPYPEEAESGQKWAVNRIDTEPEVSMFHFPWKGKPVDLTAHVVEKLCLSERTRWTEH